MSEQPNVHPSENHEETITTVDPETTPDYLLRGMYAADFKQSPKKHRRGDRRKLVGKILVIVGIIGFFVTIFDRIYDYMLATASWGVYKYDKRLSGFAFWMTFFFILMFIGFIIYAVGDYVGKKPVEPEEAAEEEPVHPHAGKWTCPKCGMSNENVSVCQWCAYEP